MADVEFAYMDDFSLEGDANTVAADVEKNLERLIPVYNSIRPSAKSRQKTSTAFRAFKHFQLSRK